MFESIQWKRKNHVFKTFDSKSNEMFCICFRKYGPNIDWDRNALKKQIQIKAPLIVQFNRMKWALNISSLFKLIPIICAFSIDYSKFIGPFCSLKKNNSTIFDFKFIEFRILRQIWAIMSVSLAKYLLWMSYGIQIN